MGVMRTLNSRGDTAYAWPETETVAGAESMSPEEVKAKFDEIVKGQRFLAFAPPSPGAIAERVTDFPENASEIILVPQFVGG